MQAFKTQKFFYGWVVVAITALTLFISAGVRSAPGVFILPLEQEMGWSRSEISLAVSIGLIVLGIAAPLSGWLMDRFGPKWVTLVGLLLVVVAMVSSYMIKELWQLNLLWGMLSGLGTGMVGGVLGPAVANRWFVARRGFVIGIFGASLSAGQLVFVPVLMALVLSAGWRWSSVALGLFALAIILPVFFLLRDDPTDMGLAPYGLTAGEAAARPTVDPNVMQRAIRSPEFWLLAATFFVCGATSNGLIGTHLIPHAADHGIPQTTAAGMLALMGAMNFVGTIASGWLTDKYDPRKLLCIYYGFRGVSLFLLPYATGSWGLAAFAILFGLDYIATVPPTTALVADTFGRRNVGTVYGWVFCSHQVGAALAAWLGGVTRDLFGDYLLAFLVAGAIAMLAALLSLRIRHTPKVTPVAA
ncbi:MAG: MFS transporter [Caldilineaceae bacterium]|nr:MFS transporter [Caldilineaceae bacterium]